MFETLRTGVIMANKERKKGQDDKKNVSGGSGSHQVPAGAPHEPSSPPILHLLRALSAFQPLAAMMDEESEATKPVGSKAEGGERGAEGWGAEAMRTRREPLAVFGGVFPAERGSPVHGLTLGLSLHPHVG